MFLFSGHNQMSASMTQQQYQIHQQQQQQHQYRTGQYHTGSSNSMSGELAPVRPNPGTSKSLIDMSGSGSHPPQANVPMPPYSGQPVLTLFKFLISRHPKQYTQPSIYNLFVPVKNCLT